MGAQLSSQADTKAPRETLRFHPEAKGAQVRLDAQRCTARRNATFHDGIVFSQRPVLPGERVAVRVVWHEGGWCGGLRVGFTRLDPARVSAPSLPPFVCPDLELQSPTWAAMLPEGCALAGDVVCFWVNRRGRLFVRVNSGPRLLLRKGVLMGAPLWAVMDVYGTTKAIKLLGETTREDPGTAPRVAGVVLRPHPEPWGEPFIFSYTIPQPVPSPQPCHGPSSVSLCSRKPQQERNVPSVSTTLPTPAWFPAATHTSAATVPCGSSGTWPNALYVAGRSRRWSHRGDHPF
ncbi:E3 ubiquitin-protein ligase NEURL3 isoform X3 [Acinonyx jubatus]|uniref:E3 ubiquitin-protein ligase NEURL3 isoform X3 n=1 Tax=Acinonyx jubatus TaxID=32536 RepID=A0ABM3NC12_ACIJB|nr:E3 ubiquitin-protein ligase NEURL3 isoform X3 [Acinonyx jubatus]